MKDLFNVLQVKKDPTTFLASSARKQYDNNVIKLEDVSFIKLPSWLIDTIYDVAKIFNCSVEELLDPYV